MEFIPTIDFVNLRYGEKHKTFNHGGLYLKFAGSCGYLLLR